MVDGVLASCYASIPHDLGQIGMTPMRWFPEIIQWIFGYDKRSPTYVGIAEPLGKWMLPEVYQEY